MKKVISWGIKKGSLLLPEVYTLKRIAKLNCFSYNTEHARLKTKDYMEVYTVIRVQITELNKPKEETCRKLI